MTSDNFSVTSRSSPDECRLMVSGELDIASERTVLTQFNEVLDGAQPPRLVVDLTSVSFIDSSGLRTVLQCRDRAQAQGRTFALHVGDNRCVRKLLEVAGVEAWFDYD